MTTRNILLAMAIAACGVLSLGCFSGEKFTKPNFDTIYVGQNAGDVMQTLGQPTQQSEYVWTYIHNRPYYKGCIKVGAEGSGQDSFSRGGPPIGAGHALFGGQPEQFLGELEPQRDGAAGRVGERQMPPQQLRPHAHAAQP